MKTFFAWYIQFDEIASYRKTLEENIFNCIELTKQGYLETIMMPVNRFYNFLKWKAELEREKQKIINENIAKSKGKR